MEDLFGLVLSQFNKYHPPGNLKFSYLGIFQSLKLRFSMEKVLSLKLNFTPNTLRCNGLTKFSLGELLNLGDCIVGPDL